MHKFIINNTTDGGFEVYTNDTGVRGVLCALIERCNQGAPVLRADLYDILDMPCVYIDNKCGWTKLNPIVKTGHGFYFPKPVGIFDVTEYVADNGPTVADVIGTLNDQQKKAVYACVAEAARNSNAPESAPELLKVHYSGPVTTAIWSDGTKTHVRIAGDRLEEDDPEKALAMVVLKKYMGAGNFRKLFKRFGKKPETKKPVTVGDIISSILGGGQ